jgi:hypothetical protein
MSQYSLDEQTAIVRDGVQLLAGWTGTPVASHRAGDYGADARTLEALRRNGIRVDSSLFFGNPRSPLNGLGMPRNRPSLREGVLEIPVTVYQRDARPSLFGNAVPPISSIGKIDPDWFSDPAEARMVIDAAVDSQIPYVVVFLHSFSFLEDQGEGRRPALRTRSMDVFRAMLDHIAEQHLPVLTMRGVAEVESKVGLLPGQDRVPRVGVKVGLPMYVWHQLRASGSLRIVNAAALALLTVGGLWVIGRRYRRSASLASLKAGQP